MRIICVAAARPNFMKIKPVMDGLERRDVEVSLVHTGQHYDPLMSDVFFGDLGIRQPDHHLAAGSGSHATHTGKVMVGFEALLKTHPTDAVVVVGDVNSTMACAVAGAKAGVRVAHVEAGLRSRDWAMPEEINRVVTDRVSDLLLAPSEDAVDNLRAEGYRSDQVHLVGNVMIDTLISNIDRARALTTLRELDLVPGGYGLVTLHRPSNVDDSAVLAELVTTLEIAAKQLPLVFAVHPRTRRQVDRLGLSSRIKTIDPLGYLDFLALQSSASVVMTDSGGLQEETTALGIPCLTMRTTTERPATISEGTNRLVGLDREVILSNLEDVLINGVEQRCPDLWDGKAGERIADVLVSFVGDPQAPRPTDLPAGF